MEVFFLRHMGPRYCYDYSINVVLYRTMEPPKPTYGFTHLAIAPIKNYRRVLSIGCCVITHFELLEIRAQPQFGFGNEQSGYAYLLGQACPIGRSSSAQQHAYAFEEAEEPPETSF